MDSSNAIAALQKRLAFLEKMNHKLEMDLEDRLAIEKELAHMASFAELDPNPIVETNVAGTVGYLNPKAIQMFPTLEKEGRAHAIFKDLDTVLEEMKQRGEALFNRTLKIDGRVFDEQVSILDGGPRIRLYLSDITELKRLDQLKNDFVNMVSHELRAPLTSMVAGLKMITNGLLGSTTKDQEQILNLSLHGIERLCRIINDLLDISKIEEGKVELHKARFDMATLVKEVVQSFEPLAHERHLEIKPHVESRPIEVEGDRDKLLQVLTNLVNNALKFTPKGSIEIFAEWKDNVVECRVKDTGVGIPPEDLPKVFGKFQQFGPATRKEDKGTGLGLSLCKGLIELHGGKIWVESQPNVGTQFIFVLPQDLPKAA